ncbi:MAG: hypothetical protein Q8O01_01940 [Candidatus Omnitrophota bacterium]|nr:hypothetical protein [Candidatus Omnitrophota bacterium]
MRRSFNILVFLSIALSFGGCDSNQYQIVTGSDGALYRFNRKTGALSMVMEDKKVVRLAESQKSEVVKEESSASLEKPINWKESKYPGKALKAKLETIWRENKLCYKISLYPYKSLEKIFARKKQDYMYSLMKPGLIIELVDKNGFLVKEIKVNLWSMAKGDGGDSTRMPESANELILNSQMDCTKQSYRSIGGYVVKWALESDMIEDEKDNFIKSSPIRSER